MDSVDKLNALTIPTAPFADFCRNFEGGVVENCGVGVHPDVDDSRGNVLHGG